MFSDRWRRGEVSEADLPHSGTSASAASQNGSAQSRKSSGLEQFFGHIRGEKGLNILDLSGVSQANVGFITSLGHRLYSQDLIATLDAAFSGGDFYQNQADGVRRQLFLDQNFQFDPSTPFDGVLFWDTLEFLAPALLSEMVERLRATVRPGSYLFGLFHAEERAATIQSYCYRIANFGTTVDLSPRGMRKPAQFFSNRAVEKLFQGFENVKFFLTRDSLREVIVKR